MRHPDEGTIHAWLDGALPPDDSRAVEAHLETCAACASAVAEARGMIAGASRILMALDGVPGGVVPGSREGRRVEAGPAAAPAWGASAEGPDAPRARARRVSGGGWWHSPVLRAAAVLLLVVGGLYLVLPGGSPTSSPAMQFAWVELPPAIVTAAEGEEMDAASVGQRPMPPAPPAPVPSPARPPAAGATPAVAGVTGAAERTEETVAAADRQSGAGTAGVAAMAAVAPPSADPRPAPAGGELAARQGRVGDRLADTPAALSLAPDSSARAAEERAARLARERAGARLIGEGRTALSEVVVTGVAAARAGVDTAVPAPEREAAFRLEERLRRIEPSAAPAAAPEPARRQAGDTAPSPAGCYRFDRPLGPSAAGELERGETAWHVVWLAAAGSVERPLLPTARREAYLGRSSWHTAGDTLVVRVFDGLTGWDLVLLPDGNGYVGSATYLADAIGPGAEQRRVPVRAVRERCPAAPFR